MSAASTPARAWSAVLFTVLAFAPVGCDEADVVGPDDEQTAVEVAFGRDRSDFAGAAWTLRDATVEGDTLVLEIRHGGGCARHSYRVVAVEGFLALPDAGPVPAVAVPLALSHDDGGDLCEALLFRTVRRDLAPLRDAYRERVSPTGAARLLLRIPTGEGSDEVRTVTWDI